MGEYCNTRLLKEVSRPKHNVKDPQNTPDGRNITLYYMRKHIVMNAKSVRTIRKIWHVILPHGQTLILNMKGKFKDILFFKDQVTKQ